MERRHGSALHVTREAFRRYVAGSVRDRQLERLNDSVEALRSEAKATPAGKLTIRQIDAEIKTARRQRPSSTQPVR